MKTIEKKKSVSLREEGYSIKEISKLLGVAKSSVSLWVRNVELTEAQKLYLKNKGLLREEIERRRKTRLANEKEKRNLTILPAQHMVPKLNFNNIWLMGIMLYWGEGGKTRRTVRFSNSDPRLIKFMMVFFREVCNVQEAKFRGHIHIHEHLNLKRAERYWLSVSQLPEEKLYKTYIITNRKRQSNKDTLPLGTFDIYVLDTFLFYKIIGWTRGISERLGMESIVGFDSDDKI